MGSMDFDCLGSVSEVDLGEGGEKRYVHQSLLSARDVQLRQKIS